MPCNVSRKAGEVVVNQESNCGCINASDVTDYIYLFVKSIVMYVRICIDLCWSGIEPLEAKAGMVCSLSTKRREY